MLDPVMQALADVTRTTTIYLAAADGVPMDRSMDDLHYDMLAALEHAEAIIAGSKEAEAPPTQRRRASPRGHRRP